MRLEAGSIGYRPPELTAQSIVTQGTPIETGRVPKGTGRKPSVGRDVYIAKLRTQYPHVPEIGFVLGLTSKHWGSSGWNSTSSLGREGD